jgi:SnoaL-like domain
VGAPPYRPPMHADLPHPVLDLLRAANAHDTAGFVGRFTPDGVVDDWGREFRGAEAIRGWSDAEFIGVEVTLDVTGVEMGDDAVVVAAQVGGQGFNGPSHFAFEIDGDLISRMTILA